MTINPSFSPDGELVASIVDQGAARICDRAGRVVASVGSHDQYAAITSAVWSPDGRSLVTAERSGTVRWWTRDGKEERSFLPGPAGPATLRFSPDGRLLAVVGVDRIVRLLEPSGRVVATLQGHRDSPIGVRWVKCGGPILTFAGSEMRLWTEDGSEICVLRSPGDKIRGAVTDPAGRRIAVGDQDGVLRIWIVDPADLLAFGERRRTRAFSAEERSRYAALLGEAK
jgi:WD40 repeat protein